MGLWLLTLALLPVGMQDSPEQHVRMTERRILGLVDSAAMRDKSTVVALWTDDASGRSTSTIAQTSSSVGLNDLRLTAVRRTSYFRREADLIDAAQAALDQQRPLPQPLRDAVMLLGWRGEDLPRIEAVRGRPAGGTTTATVEGWVRYDDGHNAFPIIYVRTDTDVYRAAAGGDYQAVVRLAGILAHERWHLRNGPDEMGAYNAQLTTMEYLHANTMHLAVVRQALQRLRDQAKNRPAVR